MRNLGLLTPSLPAHTGRGSRDLRALSDDELVALVLSQAQGDGNAIEIGRRILSDHGGLVPLCNNGLIGSAAQGGISDAAATLLSICLEIAKRISASSTHSAPADAQSVARRYGAENMREELHLLCLDHAGAITKDIVVYRGEMACPPFTRDGIVRLALREGSPSIITAHIIPARECLPSAEEIAFVNGTRGVASDLGIVMKDHVIISQIGYYSFAASHCF